MVSKKRLAREKASAERWRKMPNGKPVNLSKSKRGISKDILLPLYGSPDKFKDSKAWWDSLTLEQRRNIVGQAMFFGGGI